MDQGVKLTDKGKCKEAIEKYSKIIANNNKIQLAYFNRGLCYIQTDEYKKALKDFNTILNLKTLGGGTVVFTLNEQHSNIIEEAGYQVSYDDGIYGRAQARYYLDSLNEAYNDFQNLIKNNYPEKVFCILFQSDIWSATGDDSTACEYARRARKFAKRQDEIADCDRTIQSYCSPNNNR